MLMRLEGTDDSHWSVHSPNIYDALSVMYAPQGTNTMKPINASTSPQLTSSTSSLLFPTSNAPLVSPLPSVTVLEKETSKVFQRGEALLTSPLNKKKQESARNQDILPFCLIIQTVLRQCFHILKMRTREILTSATQFIFTQNILPFLVVLGVVVGCRDVRYPRVELSSKNINGIGEVCVGLGPRSSSTRSHTPLSSPYEKVQKNDFVNNSAIDHSDMHLSRDNYYDDDDDDGEVTASPRDPEPMSEATLPIEGSATTKMLKMLIRLWRQFMQFFNPSRTSGDPKVGSGSGQMGASRNISGSGGDTMTRHQHKQQQQQRKRGNQSYEDSLAAKEYPGYRTLLSLLGESLCALWRYF